MNILTLEEIKLHIRIDGTEEDTVLESMGEVAEQMVITACRRTIDNIYETYGEVPVQLRHAMLMLVDYHYNNRGEDKALPRAAAMLIRPFIKLR